MGFTRLQFTVSHPIDLTRSTHVELLVDTGALISFVPRDVLGRVGAPRHFRRVFRLANGHLIERDLGAAVFSWDGHACVATVAFGEPGDEPVLGVTALEAMGLLVDPGGETLRPTDSLLV